MGEQPQTLPEAQPQQGRRASGFKRVDGLERVFGVRGAQHAPAAHQRQAIQRLHGLQCGPGVQQISWQTKQRPRWRVEKEKMNSSLLHVMSALQHQSHPGCGRTRAARAPPPRKRRGGGVAAARAGRMALRM